MSCIRGPFNVDDSDMESDMQSSVSSCGADSTTNSQAEGNDMENGSDGNPGELEQMKMFAAVETARVNRWKLFVIITILVVGGAVSTFTFLTLSNEQSTDATNAFQLFANTINDAFTFRVKVIFDSNRELSRSITSSALEHGGTFPYYAVKSFEAKAYEAREEANFLVVAYAPIATSETTWLKFSKESRGWLEESKYTYDQLQPGQNRAREPMSPPLDDIVWSFDEGTTLTKRKGRGIFAPTFMISPPPVLGNGTFENIDLFSNPVYKDVAFAAVTLKDSVFTAFSDDLATWADGILGADIHQKIHDARHPVSRVERHVHPHTLSAQPVFDSLSRETKVVGYLFSIFAWDHILVDLLPEGVIGIIIVIRNTCDQFATYVLNGNEAVFLGNGDLHDASYNKYRRTVDFSENYFNPEATSSTAGHCQIILDVYPSNAFVDPYQNNIPAVFTTVIAILFIIMAAIFAVYNRFVQSRNNKVVNAAARSNAIVSSLFPSNVRERLLAENNVDGNGKGKSASTSNVNADGVYKSKPIADLFPETTVMFGDIVGFTAWSSVRDPTQVFTLLETVYHAFDELAHKRRIFKVETIGDCYVAVCGLPEPNKNHAVNMARFAKDCMYKMWTLSKKLEATLGPDTGDLTMRMGLHSGPVTAGVLRGERSRFQLFGDTVNTAARMESNGLPDKIQLSQETADLLLAAGKTGWIVAREEKVNAKGKGMLQTYFLNLEDDVNHSHGNSTETEDETTAHLTSFGDTEDFMELANVAEKAKATPLGSAKNMRLVEWNADILLRHLKQIVQQRQRSNRVVQAPPNEDVFLQKSPETTVMDEVKEIIDLPGCAVVSAAKDEKDVNLDPDVVDQLRLYMKEIGGKYQNNPFHNFEHASHVTMSVQKLLSRIVAPSDIDRAYQGNTADHTYGITSDPLTQFSCILSALIHDVDHPGVPNATLVKERTLVARRYKNKSVAEQNSVDLSWDLLMEPRFAKLRAAIYVDDAEMQRFRQLIVNSVMATDIVDPEQKAFRNARWEKAFHSNESILEEKNLEINRKATIVIEHLIQASDVSHMMQHWHIYRKWNERFFMECYQAYKMGRAKDDPALGWYKGEIGFFDFYIIPLAKKLKECGVFGVSCDEYLNYAVKNRQEWESRGQEIVSEMVENANALWKEQSEQMGSRSSGQFVSRNSMTDLTFGGTRKSFRVKGYSVLDL